MSSPSSRTPAHPAGTLAAAEVVLVSFRSREHVAELLRSWPEELRVTVVDNSADVDGVRGVVEARPRTRYLDGGGVGFARGANLGARASEAEYLVFVNPDCRPSADDLAALVRGLAEDPTALAHAATMTDAEGAVEAGVGGWEPSVPRLLVHALGLHRRLPTGGLFARPAAGEHVDVDWVTGACMAVRARVFRELGGFDESFYVYAEDVSLGREARRRGWRCVLREDVTVSHGAGRSGAPSAEMLRLRGASFAWYLTRYHRRWSLLLRWLMVLGAVTRSVPALVRRDAETLRGQLQLCRGLLSRRAFVGGREVAARRFAEVAAAG
ncbi:glycosyltransferase family 2 protein [Auraticoccus cholistanensis]|uniref:glycosyltransferase family 2 protein n=1 Tax=Auraticoccus cholistanensis TaxID=2656650 RepID=UPI0018D2311B